MVPDFRGPPAKISRDMRCPKSHRTIMMCVQGGSLVQHPVREGKAVTKPHTKSVQDWVLKTGDRCWHLHTVG